MTPPVVEHMPLDKVNGRPFRFCETLSHVKGDSLVPGESINLVEVVQNTGLHPRYCEVIDIMNSQKKDSYGSTYMADLQKAVFHLAGNVKLYYFGSCIDKTGQRRIYPKKYNALTNGLYSLCRPREELLLQCIKPEEAHKWQIRLQHQVQTNALPISQLFNPGNAHTRQNQNAAAGSPAQNINQTHQAKFQVPATQAADSQPILRLPTGAEHLQTMLETYRRDYPDKSTLAVESFCSNKPVGPDFINKYVRLLRSDWHRQPGLWVAYAFDCTTPDDTNRSFASFQQSLPEVNPVSKMVPPTRYFVPCWTATHSCLLVIRIKARPQPSIIEIWDPVPSTERLKWDHPLSAVNLLQEFFNATIESELTHICDLPPTVESRASWLMMLNIMTRLGRCPAAAEHEIKHEVLEWEWKHSSKWKMQDLGHLQKIILWEVFISHQLS